MSPTEILKQQQITDQLAAIYEGKSILFSDIVEALAQLASRNADQCGNPVTAEQWDNATANLMALTQSARLFSRPQA